MSEAKKVDVLDQLEQDGKYIAAEIKTARKYEAAFKEKAGVELEKANNHWLAATQRLVAARILCAEAKVSFKQFKEKWAPDVSRATLYRVIAIGSGKVDIEEQRQNWREEQQERRAKKKGESQTKSKSETDKPKQAAADAVTESIVPASFGAPKTESTKPEPAKTEPAKATKPEPAKPEPVATDMASLSKFEEGVEMLRKIMTQPAAKFAVTYISTADLASVADFLKLVAEKKTKKAA
jgi:hypothetical protein